MKKLILFLFLLPLSLFSQKLILRNLTDTTTLKICVHGECMARDELVTIGPGQRAEVALSIFCTYTVTGKNVPTYTFFTGDPLNWYITFSEPEPNKA